MDFKNFCELVGLQFLIVATSILLKCFCKAIHKGDYSPDNPLQPIWCSIICSILAILSLPIYAFINITHKYLSDIYVQIYKQDQREFNEQLHDSYYRQGYSDGFNAGIKEGKSIGYLECEYVMQKQSSASDGSGEKMA